MSDHLGDAMRRVKDDKGKSDTIQALDEGDIAILKSYGAGPYTNPIKQVEEDIKSRLKRVKELCGVKVFLTLTFFYEMHQLMGWVQVPVGPS